MQSSCFLGLSRSLTQQVNHSSLKAVLQRDLTRLGGPRSPFSSSAWRNNASCASKNAMSTTYQQANRFKASLPFWVKAGGVAGVGLGLSVFTAPTVFCERELPYQYLFRPSEVIPAANPTVTPTPLSKPSQASPGFQSPEAPPPPQSSVSYYELTFGTVAGICAGVFVKKGAKAVAFMLGGVFVLLQVSRYMFIPHLRTQCYVSSILDHSTCCALIGRGWLLASRISSTPRTPRDARKHPTPPRCSG